MSAKVIHIVGWLNNEDQCIYFFLGISLGLSWFLCVSYCSVSYLHKYLF